ncbi:hypothetical protein WA158_006069 [Blastocystis sp. Blastoise]
MGKEKRKQKKNGSIFKNPTVEAPQGFNAKEVLGGLDSPNEDTRIASSGVLSALFGDADTMYIRNMNEEEDRSKTNIKYAIQSQIPKKMINHLSDSAEAVVLNCLGALRNMCISGGNDIIKYLIEKDICTPLTAIISNYTSKLQSTIISVYVPTILAQTFSLLTLIFDYDANCVNIMKIDDSTISYIFTCIAFNNDELKQTACDCLDMMSDIYHLSPLLLQQLYTYIPQTQGYVKARLLSVYISSNPPSSLNDILPYLSEITTGISVNLSHEIEMTSDIYQHVLEDEKENDQNLAKIAGININIEQEINIDDNDDNNNDNGMNEDDDNDTKSCMNKYINIISTLGAYIDLLKTILDIGEEEEQKQTLLPSSSFQGLYPSIAALLTPTPALLSLSPYLISPTLDLYISLYESLDILNHYLSHYEHTTISNIWSLLLNPVIPLEPVQPLCVEKHLFDSIFKCIWSYLEGIQTLKQQQGVNISLTPANILQQTLSLYPSCSISLFNLISIYILLYPLQNDSIPYIQIIANSLGNNDIEISAACIDCLITIFSDTPAVPLYKQMNIHTLFKSGVNHLYTLLNRNTKGIEEDIINFAYNTYENGMNFVDYIEEEMSKL